jgi:hypothetical protein
VKGVVGGDWSSAAPFTPCLAEAVPRWPGNAKAKRWRVELSEAFGVIADSVHEPRRLQRSPLTPGPAAPVSPDGTRTGTLPGGATWIASSL